MTQIPDDIYPSFDYTYRPVYGEDVKLFDNTFYCLPDEAQANDAGAAYLVAKGVDTRYYPTTGSSNFFAYYIDDAVNPDNGLEQTVFGEADVAALTKDAVTEGEEPMAYKYVDFQLDGSQDVMAGMAAHRDNYVGFSAMSARHNVHPQITMDHLLTRLTFSVVAGNVNANGVSVTDIAVTSKSVGQLKVAYDANTPQSPDNLITWDETVEPVLFHLQERAKDEGGNPIFVDEAGEKTPLQALSPYTFELAPEYQYTAETAAQSLGDALFVAPGEESYDLVVQTAYAQEGYQADPIPLKITLPSGNVLERGKSYNVTIVVYGLSEVKVYATLTPWVESDEIIRLNEDILEDNNFNAEGQADLTKFSVEDADAVTYDAESATIVTTEALKGVQLLAGEDDAVSGQELRVTFAEEAQVKIIVTYADDTEAILTMDAAAAIAYLALDEEKTIKKIQIQPLEPATVVLSEVKVNAETTEP